MEQITECASCQNLSSLVQKLHTKFAIYKKKNIQNDEFINTFRKQNILMQALKDELQDKNKILAESLNKLKYAEIECSALRETLEKQKEESEKQMAAKFKDSDLELQTLRNERDTLKIELEGLKITNIQLSEKLDEEATKKMSLQDSFAEEKKQLQEKVSEAERFTITFNRHLKSWSCLKEKRNDLLRSVLCVIRKYEKRIEAAALEANLLNNSDTSDFSLDSSSCGSDISPSSTPKRNKSKDTLKITDLSDDDFEEVCSNQKASPAKKLPKNISCNISGSGIGKDDADLSKEETGSPAKRNSMKSPRKATCKTPPRKYLIRKGTPQKVSRREECEVANDLESAGEKDTSVVRHVELVSTGCDPMEQVNVIEERAENRCLASYRKEYSSRCGSLSPFPDACLPGREPSIAPVGIGSSKNASVLCYVCDSLLQRCAPCQSILSELVASKRLSETESGLTNDFRSPAKETAKDSKEAGSLFSPPRSQKQDSKCVSEPPTVENETLLNFGDSIPPLVEESLGIQTNLTPVKERVGIQTSFTPPVKEGVGIQTSFTPPVKEGVGIQRTNIRSSDVCIETRKIATRSIGLQCDFTSAIDKRSRNPCRHTAEMESTTNQKEAKCAFCDNKTDTVVCPMKEFLKTSLLSVIKQSKYVTSVAMMDFLESSLLNLMKQSDFILSCSGVYSGYSSLGPMNMPSFCVPHPGLFPNEAASMYAMFNPCFYTSEDPTHRTRSLHNAAFPMFKKEEMPRPNCDGSDREEHLRKRRSLNRKNPVVCKQGLESESRRTSWSPNDRELEESDSSIEEIEVRKAGTKKRLKISHSSSGTLPHNRKKLKGCKQSDGGPGSQSLESCEKNPDSPVKKRYCRILRLSNSSLEEEQETPKILTSSPKSPDQEILQKDQISEADVLSSQEETQSAVPSVLLPLRLQPAKENGKVVPVEEDGTRQTSLVEGRRTQKKTQIAPPAFKENSRPFKKKSNSSIAHKLRKNDISPVCSQGPKRYETKSTAKSDAAKRKKELTLPTKMVATRCDGETLKPTSFALEDDLCLSDDSDDDETCREELETKEEDGISASRFGELEEAVEEDNQEVKSQEGSLVSETQTKESASTISKKEDFVQMSMNLLGQQEIRDDEVLRVLAKVPEKEKEGQSGEDLSETCEENVGFVGKSQQDLATEIRDHECTSAAEEAVAKASGTEEENTIEKGRVNVQEQSAICEDLADLEERVSEEPSSECEKGDCPLVDGQTNVQVSSDDCEMKVIDSANYNRKVSANEETEDQLETASVSPEDKNTVRSEGPVKETENVIPQKRKVLLTGSDKIQDARNVKQKRDTSIDSDAALPVETGCTVEATSPELSVSTNTGSSSALPVVLPLAELEKPTEENLLAKGNGASSCCSQQDEILNHLDATEISSIVEVFPHDEVSANDLDLSTKDKNKVVEKAMASLFGLEEPDCDAVETNIPGNPGILAGNGFQLSADEEELETVLCTEETGIKTVSKPKESRDVGLYDDLDEVEDIEGAEEAVVISDGEKEVENQSLESVFGSLFEDLSETDPNLSVIGGVVAAVMPDLSDNLCIAEEDSSKMVIDGGDFVEERLLLEEPAAAEKVLPVVTEIVAQVISDNEQDSAESPGQEKTQSSVARGNSDKKVGKSEVKTVEMCSSTSPVADVLKRRLPVVAAPIGPYHSRRTSRAPSNQKNSLSRQTATNAIPEASSKATTTAETSSSSSGLRLRGAAKSPVPSKKKKVVSKEFVSSESSSESDSERLVISEKEDDCSSGRSSPQNEASGRSTPLHDSYNGCSSVVDNGEVESRKNSESTETATRNLRQRLKTVQTPKERRYNTRQSASSRTSESETEDAVNVDEPPKQKDGSEGIEGNGNDHASSDETCTYSPPCSKRKPGQSGPNTTPESPRRSLRNLSKRQISSSNDESSDKEVVSPSDVEVKVVCKSLKADLQTSPKRASKLQKLRNNLSKVHPLMQKVSSRTEPPLKKSKCEKAEESRVESRLESRPESRASAAISMQMAKSGRTACLIAEEPVNLRQGRWKDLPKITPPERIPTRILVKPRITPQERLAALQASSNNVEVNAKEVIRPRESMLNEQSNNSEPSNPELVKTLPTSILPKPKIIAHEKSATLRLADTAGAKPGETSAESTQKNPISAEPQPAIKTVKLPPKNIVANIPKKQSDEQVFKRSNSIRDLPANRPRPAVQSSIIRLTPNLPPVPELPANNSDDIFGVETVVPERPDFSVDVSRENVTILPGVVKTAVGTVEMSCTESHKYTPPVISDIAKSTFNGVTSPAAVTLDPCKPSTIESPLSSSTPNSPCVSQPIRPKRSDIWVEPAKCIGVSCKTPQREEELPMKATFSAPPSPADVQTVIKGRALVAMIDSTPLDDTHSTSLVDSDLHPLLLAWRGRGANQNLLRGQAAAVAEGMGKSVPAIRKLLNAYLSSPYFTEELLTRTVNSLLNPQYLWVDVIVSRLVVEMVETDYDSQPCIDTPGPGQFMTKIQQQLIALIMRLFPKYRSIVRDVLLLIEHRMFSLGQLTDQGRLPWLTVFHTSLCRVMKWRHQSLIFCYDAMYCFVSRFATVLSSVFQVWPHLLPTKINYNTTGIIYQVMFHFIMTQGEPDKQSDLKSLRHLLIKKGLYSGRTNSIELAQKIACSMKENKCGLISPALILLSKREDIAWAQDHIVNQQLLPILRDWLLNHESPGCPPLPPAAVLTLCGIVRAFRGPESSVPTTHTIMKTLLLDTKAVADIPDLEHVVCAGLVFLARHNIEFVVEILKKWRPTNKCPKWLVELLLHLMSHRARPPVWWSKEMRCLLDQVELFPFTAKVKPSQTFH